jgi:hypothetical protein
MSETKQTETLWAAARTMLAVNLLNLAFWIVPDTAPEKIDLAHSLCRFMSRAGRRYGAER